MDKFGNICYFGNVHKNSGTTAATAATPSIAVQNSFFELFKLLSTTDMTEPFH